MRYVAFALLLAAAVVLYARHLGDAPVYMTPDEVIISVDAHSIATTGRDVHGVSMPLFFKVQMRGEKRMGWFMPVIFYAIAAVLKVMPLSEVSARLPTVLVGLADIVLIFFVARTMFRSQSLALIAAAMLALTPAHFILSRYALDYLYPVPFLLAWLLCLLAYLERGRTRTLFAATFILGVGFYSYIAAVLMTPVYLIFTSGILFYARKPLREYAIAAAGFAVPLLPFVLWYAAHPTAFADTVGRYAVYDTSSMDALQGLRSFLSYNSLESRAAVYWSFLNPSFLFFTGDLQMPFSTRAVGVFLYPSRCSSWPALRRPSGIRRRPRSLRCSDSLRRRWQPCSCRKTARSSARRRCCRSPSCSPHWVSQLCGRGRSGRARSCGDAGGARRAARRDCLWGLEPDVPWTSHELHGSAHRRGHWTLHNRVCFRCDQHHEDRRGRASAGDAASVLTVFPRLLRRLSPAIEQLARRQHPRRACGPDGA